MDATGEGQTHALEKSNDDWTKQMGRRKICLHKKRTTATRIYKTLKENLTNIISSVNKTTRPQDLVLETTSNSKTWENSQNKSGNKYSQKWKPIQICMVCLRYVMSAVLQQYPRDSY